MIYIESFHEDKKVELSGILQKENWKKVCIPQTNSLQQGQPNSDALSQSCPVQQLILDNELKFLKVPSLHKILFSKEIKVNILNRLMMVKFGLGES